MDCHSPSGFAMTEAACLAVTKKSNRYAGETPRPQGRGAKTKYKNQIQNSNFEDQISKKAPRNTTHNTCKAT